MLGQGSGASIAILAASADRRIKVLDLLDPWGDWPEWLKESPLVPEAERPNYLKPEFLARVAPLDPVLHLPRLSSRSIRMQQVLADVVNPKACNEHLAAAAPPTTKVVQFDDTQAYYEAWKIRGSFGWIKEELLRIGLPDKKQ